MRLSTRTQLLQWRHGQPMHNRETNECCPDFSCCDPLLLAPEHERLTFYTAVCREEDALVDQLLMGFLGRLIAAHKPNARIAGDDGTLQ